MKQYRFWLVVVLLISLVSAWIDLQEKPRLRIEGVVDTEFQIVQGLDLQGGSRVLLRPEIGSDQYDTEDMEVARDIVERRVNGLGLSEAVVQLQGNDSILVELPGVSDRDVALQTVQSTGLLEFVDFSNLSPTVLSIVSQDGACILTSEQVRIQQAREANDANTTSPTETPMPPDQVTPTAEPTAAPTEEAIFGRVEANSPADTPAQDGGEEERGPCPDGSFPIGRDGVPNGIPFTTVMTGGGLDDAAAITTQLGGWEVSFVLTNEGSQVFGAHTSANVGQPMAIVLDGVVLSAPTINAAITDSGVIQGNFTQEEAESLAVQLRYGALPVPLEVSAFDNVGPTLGEISIDRSVTAGTIGVIVVLLFMIIYYRVPGIAAALALIVFAGINFALYKTIPVTLTLPAITGFLISIGTAVDGNILIFERMKEELRAGRSLNRAIELGFERAWTSIRDSNLSTALICGILFFFGRTFGASSVQGFAITLAIGLAINLFTALIVTRTFLTTLLKLFGKSIEGNKTLMGA